MFSINPQLKKTAIIFALIFAPVFSDILRAELRLPHSLSDHILFQQDEPIVLWGKADSNSKITAELTDEKSGVAIDSAGAVAGVEGRWQISLKPLKASFKRYSIKITNGGDTRLIHNVLVGELWLSGGQSNMHLALRYILGGQELMNRANCSALRVFHQDTVDEAWREGVSQTPSDDTPNGQWQPADSGKNVADCSGVAYAFALALYDSLNQNGKEVPVGMINTAVGATGVTCWMSRTAMEKETELKAKLPAQWNVGKWNKYHKPWNQPTALYNHKIAPLTSHAVRGFIWYQGENDAGSGETGAKFYKTALTTLIADWRKQWGGKMRPFILTQLHAYDTDGKMPLSKLDSWAYMRETQFEVGQTVPQTAAIAIHDVPLIWDVSGFAFKSPIHPVSKQPVGQRMALAARAIAYGENVEYQGPVFDHMEVAGGKAILHFNHAKGLKVGDGGRLLGFAVCGADRRFVEAEARIVGETVEVANRKVKSPVAVTYGFTSQNHCANLFGGTGLPAFPFRTDKIKSEFLKGCTEQAAAEAINHALQTKANNVNLTE